MKTIDTAGNAMLTTSAGTGAAAASAQAGWITWMSTNSAAISGLVAIASLLVGVVFKLIAVASDRQEKAQARADEERRHRETLEQSKEEERKTRAALISEQRKTLQALLAASPQSLPPDA